jgi:hypothetical protein
MTLGPLLVALCVNAGSSYREGCKVALSQAAAQSGADAEFSKITKRSKNKLINLVDPSKEAELTIAVLGYATQMISKKEANLSVKNPFSKKSSISLTAGEDKVSLGFRIEF